MLTIADDWEGAWHPLPWSRPDDWRDVANLLAWDVAAVGAGWAHLEAAHQLPDRQVSLRLRLDELAEVVADDLPYLLGVGPTAPAEGVQPRLPLLLPDDPPLERLYERPRDMSWRLYFWMNLKGNVDRILHRAAPGLRAQALEDLGRLPSGLDIGLLGDDTRFHALLPADDAWWAGRTIEDRELAERLGEQVALQVECLLRDQLPTVLPLLEESIAVGVEDAALGGAVHVETDADDQPVALRLVSHDGRPRAPVWTAGRQGAPLRQLIAGAGLGDLSRPRVQVG